MANADCCILTVFATRVVISLVQYMLACFKLMINKIMCCRDEKNLKDHQISPDCFNDNQL